LEEKRRFIIRGREEWLEKEKLPKELGCPPKECEKIWEEAKCYTDVMELENQRKILHALSDLVLYSGFKTGVEDLVDIAVEMGEHADRIDDIVDELRKKCKLPPSEE
jgi:hypothetical protein